MLARRPTNTGKFPGPAQPHLVFFVAYYCRSESYFYTAKVGTSKIDSSSTPMGPCTLMYIRRLVSRNIVYVPVCQEVHVQCSYMVDNCGTRLMGSSSRRQNRAGVCLTDGIYCFPNRHQCMGTCCRRFTVGAKLSALLL